jgi:mRNA interferase HigB
MHVIARRRLREFWEAYRDAEQQLKSWCAEARHAEWERPHDVKEQYPAASIIRNNRVVFDICGNKYRLVVLIKYEFKMVYVRFIGTHAEYGRIDAEEI